MNYQTILLFKNTSKLLEFHLDETNKDLLSRAIYNGICVVEFRNISGVELILDPRSVAVLSINKLEAPIVETKPEEYEHQEMSKDNELLDL